MDSQQLYLEYQQLTQQFQQVQEYLESTTKNIGEVSNVIEAFESFSSLKEGSEVMAPIANGIFVETKLAQSKTLRINVGGGVVVEKTISEAKKMLEKQRSDLETLRDRANKDYITIMARLRQIETIVEQDVDGGPGDNKSKETEN